MDLGRFGGTTDLYWNIEYYALRLPPSGEIHVARVMWRWPWRKNDEERLKESTLE